MPFKRFVDDGLPRPSKYLEGGFHRPSTGDAKLGINKVGSAADVEDFIHGASEPGSQLRSLTVVGEDGRIFGVVYAPFQSLLSSPPTARPFSGRVSNMRREDHGFLAFDDPSKLGTSVFEGSSQTMDAAARAVTFDLSVAAMGLNRSLFRADDAIFVSAVLALDFAMTLSTYSSGHELITGYSQPLWYLTVPVNVDFTVLRIYQEIVKLVRPQVLYGSVLDRADLVCAATAIAYESPLYSARPEAYEGVGSMLKLIEYGPIRNKPVAAEMARQRVARVARFKEKHGRPPTDAELEPDPGTEQASFQRDSQPALDLLYQPLEDSIWQALNRGESFTPMIADELEARQAAGQEVLSLVAELLDEAAGDDLSWRMGLLALAPRLSGSDTEDLVIAVGNVLNTTRDVGPEFDQLRELAFTALGMWGSWPRDAAEEIFEELRDRPSDPILLNYLRSYLQMAEVEETAAAAELAAVAAGKVQASRQRIDALRESAAR